MDEREEAQRRFDQYEREEAVDLALALRPETTAEELRRIKERSWQRMAEGGDLFRKLGPPLWKWRGEVREALCAHPNIPLDLLAELICEGERCLTGFLRNPILPALLLEDPGFFDRIDDRSGFGFFLPLLQQQEIPPSLLRVLSAFEDPLIALEARTHIGLLEGEGTPLDLAWLTGEAQDLLHRRLSDPDNIKDGAFWKLVELGVLRPWTGLRPPWETAEFQEKLAAVPEELIASIAAEARERMTWEPSDQARWLETYTEPTPQIREVYRGDLGHLWTRLLLYSEMPVWVGKRLQELLVNLLGGSALPSVLFFWHVAATGPRSAEDPDYCKPRRETAIRSALNPLAFNPALAYLVFWECARQRSFDTLVGHDTIRYWGSVGKPHFLYRVGLALNLDALEKLPPTRDERDIPEDLRNQLQNDPNRYVRAAAEGRFAPLMDRS